MSKIILQFKVAKTSILANADISLVLTCYILPAWPPPAPACFARHHTPQQAIAWQGLWRLGHHRHCNVRVAYTCTNTTHHERRTAIMQEGYGLGANLPTL